MVNKTFAVAAALIFALASWAPAQSQPAEKQRSPSQNQIQTVPQSQRQPIQNAPTPAPSGKNQPSPADPKKTQPAPQQNADNLSADKLGDALTATQNYLERRWLLLKLRVLAETIKAEEIDGMLQADARHIGVNGPSPDEAKQLDLDTTLAIEDFLDALEKRIRNEEAKWPADKPPLEYANASLVMLEAVRLEVAEANKSKSDLLLALRRTNRVINLTMGGGGNDYFAGRDQAVDAAMKVVKVAIPPPPKR